MSKQLALPRGAVVSALLACLLAPVAGTRAQTANEGASASAQVAPQTVVNINSANAEELQRLPGVGPERARAILELRTRLTRFARLEQLLAVKGIGRATFRKLRPLLVLNGATTLLEKPRRSAAQRSE